eukprot:scpid92366/ scgid32643/ 
MNNLEGSSQILYCIPNISWLAPPAAETMVLTSRRNSSAAKLKAGEFKRQISHPVIIPASDAQSCVLPFNSAFTSAQVSKSTCSTLPMQKQRNAPNQLFEIRARSSTMSGHPHYHQRTASAITRASTTDDDSRPSSPDSAIWTDMSSPDIAYARSRDEMQTPTNLAQSVRAQQIREVFAASPINFRTPTPSSGLTPRSSRTLSMHRSNPNIHRIDTSSLCETPVPPKRRSSVSTSRLNRVSSCHGLKRNAISTSNMSSEVHFQCWLARQPHTWC